jgi:hypothetical protein
MIIKNTPRVRQTRKDRKSQSKFARTNPNHQEQHRTTDFQRSGKYKLSHQQSHPIDPYLAMMMIGMIVLASGPQVSAHSNTKNQAPPQNTSDPLPVSLNTTTLNTSSLSNSNNSLAENTSQFFAVERQPHFFAELEVGKKNPQKQHQEKNNPENLEKIFKEDDFTSFRIYLKNNQDLSSDDFFYKAAEEFYSPKIWDFLFDKSRDGGWNFLQNKPKLFFYHVYTKAIQHDNLELAHLMITTKIIEDVKPIIATVNNIKKYIKENNIAKIKSFFTMNKISSYNFVTSEITENIFKDDLLRSEMIELSKKSTQKMKNYLLQLSEKYDKQAKREIS